MSNPGFEPYLKITTASKAAGGPDAYLSAVERSAILQAAGPLLLVGSAIGFGLTMGYQQVQQRLAERRERAREVYLASRADLDG